MPEPSTPPFARGVFDRDDVGRTTDGREASFDADPRALVLPVRDGRVLLAQRVDGSEPTLELRPPAGLPAAELRVYLGRVDGRPVEFRVFDAEAAEAIEPEPARWVGLRVVAESLGDLDSALAATAVALANWHERHPRCPRCGAPTHPVQSGWARRCEADDSLHFPRTDPAVIVLVTDDDDRVLLGSNAMWETSRYSLLAGFVEPGESLEAAVVREIGEEAGLAVDRVAYVGSQPWPFPASLMLGFTARLAPGVSPSTAKPDGDEILELRWFSRSELDAALDDVVLPGAASIARWLLERWYGGPIASDAPWATS